MTIVASWGSSTPLRVGCQVCGGDDSVATVRVFGNPTLCRSCRLLFGPLGWLDEDEVKR